MQVFQAIRSAKPPRLYIASDGARQFIEGEEKKVQAVRDYIINNIDWDCHIKTLFRPYNLGCKIAVSSAIDWFFENEEQGIILEDDCLPSQSFFWYCDDLLDKYKDNHQIMHIAGMTYKETPSYKYSYHFARVGGVWGWASWRRAWERNELEMVSYPNALEDNVFDDLFIGESEVRDYYLNVFKHAFGNNHTWDYQWTYSKIINNSINIMPSTNLVKNIGHGVEGATHTTGPNSKYCNMQTNEINFPLKHPRFVVIDTQFNYLNFRYISSKSIKQMAYHFASNYLPSMLVKHLKNLKRSFKHEKI